MESAVSDVSIT